MVALGVVSLGDFRCVGFEDGGTHKTPQSSSALMKALFKVLVWSFQIRGIGIIRIVKSSTAWMMPMILHIFFPSAHLPGVFDMLALQGRLLGRRKVAHHRLPELLGWVADGQIRSPCRNEPSEYDGHDDIARVAEPVEDEEEASVEEEDGKLYNGYGCAPDEIRRDKQLTKSVSEDSSTMVSSNNFKPDGEIIWIFQRCNRVTSPASHNHGDVPTKECEGKDLSRRISLRSYVPGFLI
jgi:hypothetical protein